MSHQLDPVAKRVFIAAIAEDRCGELLEALLDGGSATVNIHTQRLTIVAGQQLADL